MDERLKIWLWKVRNMKVWWQGCKKYSRLGGRDEIEILRVKELKILKVSWNGWKVRNTEGQVARMEDR